LVAAKFGADVEQAAIPEQQRTAKKFSNLWMVVGSPI
jgi:hypothetical protein